MPVFFLNVRVICRKWAKNLLYFEVQRTRIVTTMETGYCDRPFAVEMGCVKTIVHTVINKIYQNWVLRGHEDTRASMVKVSDI